MRRSYLPLATLILLVAAALRLWLLHLYPPGPHYDEGAYLLITRSIAFGGARFFPIVEAYQGREVLYMYLNAPLLHLFGDRIFTLRLSSAFINLITIAAAIRLARFMFRGERGIVVALAVGLVTALSFPQIFIARQAFRAVTLPMMQALALLFLWRGLVSFPRTNRKARFSTTLSAFLPLALRERGLGGEGRNYLYLAIGGFFAGGAVYTYMASRLFPFWLLIAALVLLWVDRPRWRLRLRQGALFFGVLTLTATPMAIYALQKPDIFWGRLGELTQVGQSVTLAESILLHLRMFYIEGDPYLRYNVPGRPYFTPIEGALLLVGIVVAARRLFSRHTRSLERAAYALVLLSPLMVIPSVVSVGGLPPSYMRSLGMIPLIFLLVGVGFEFLFSSILVRRLSQTAFHRLSIAMESGLGGEVFKSRLLQIITLVFLLGGGLLVGQLYFDWAGRADLFYETDADLSLAARWLAQNTGADERVYLAARDRSHPTVLIEQTPPITWLGTDTLYRTSAGNSGLYIFPRSAPPPQDWRAWLETGRITNLPLAPDGRTAFEAFRLDGDTPLPASDPLPNPAPHNGYLSLVGIQTPPIASGSSGEIVTEWRIERAPDDNDFTPILQLEDAQGFVLSRADLYMTDTNLWEQGAVIFVRLPVSVPAGTPPSSYVLRVAWVAKVRDSYAPYLDSAGAQSGIWATIGNIEVTRPAVPPSNAAVQLGAAAQFAIADGVQLAGYDPIDITIRPGEDISLRLLWQSLTNAPTSSPYRLIMRGTNADIALHDSAPLEAIYPPTQWREGDLFTERLRLTTSLTQPEGSYVLQLVTNNEELLIGGVTFLGIPRLYRMPNVENSTYAVFDDSIRLAGYTVTQGVGTLNIELVWQSLQAVTEDYTVFIHLIGEDDVMIAQQDMMPQQNTYPTRLWLADEYVVDSYAFTGINRNVARVRIGLYLQATGRRLTITNSTSDGDYFEIVMPKRFNATHNGH